MMLHFSRRTAKRVGALFLSALLLSLTSASVGTVFADSEDAAVADANPSADKDVADDASAVDETKNDDSAENQDENDNAASRDPGMTESSMPRSRRRAAKSAALRASRAADVATATVRITG